MGVDRRTKAYRDILSEMPKSDNSITEHLDGVDYRYLPEPRCRVCTAGEARKGLRNGAQVSNLVDTLLLYPKSVADVHRTIEPMMEDWPTKAKITYKSIRTHLHNHLSWDRVAMRMMVERWAQQKGINIVDAAGRMILTEEAWLEATAHFGWQLMLSGQIVPSWAETQKSFERMAAIREQAEGEYSIAEILSQLNTIIQVIREEIPPERQEYVISKIEGRINAALPDASLSTDEEMAEIVAEQERFIKEEVSNE